MKRAVVGGLLPFLVLGCALDAEEGSGDESVGEGRSTVVGENTLLPNAIHPNAIHPNAIHPNAIHPNALTSGTIDSSAMAALQDPGDAGELSRTFLQFAVSCAFTSAQSFSFSWTDSESVEHNETYWGDLGLAPGWLTRGLNDTEQKWITACLAARSNYYGVSVLISMRGGHPSLATDAAERTAYPMQEGAFWGNLFDESPFINSCYNGANVAHSRSKQRDCATGHWDGATTIDCTPIDSIGDCSTSCTLWTTPPGDADNRFATCDGFFEVITTLLPY